MADNSPNPYQAGIDERVFAELETSFGAVPTALPTTDEALRHFQPLELTPGDPKTIRADQRNTRDVLETIKGKHPPGSWSLRKYLLPNGATTLPDDHPFWLSAFGSVTATNKYAPAKLVTDSVKVWSFRGNESRVATGLVVQRLLLEAADGESPMVTFSGSLARVLYTGSGAVLAGTAAAAVFTVPDDSSTIERLEVGSLITIQETGGETENVYRVTIIDKATQTVTVTPVLVETVDSSDIWYPQQQTNMTTTGIPISADRNSITIDGNSTDIELIACTLEMVNNHSLRDRERGQKYMTGFNSNVTREVTLSMQLYLKNPVTMFMEKARAGTPMAVVITLGDETDKKVIINVPALVANIPPDQESGEDVQTPLITGRCYGVTGEDSVDIDFE